MYIMFILFWNYIVKHFQRQKGVDKRENEDAKLYLIYIFRSEYDDAVDQIEDYDTTNIKHVTSISI